MHDINSPGSSLNAPLLLFLNFLYNIKPKIIVFVLKVVSNPLINIKYGPVFKR